MRKHCPQHADQARQKMWNSMRQLHTFSVADLESTAEVGASHAQKLIKMLSNHGYLRLERPKREGVTGGHAIWRLARNTGPVVPRFGRSGVVDVNISDPYALTPSRRLERHAHAMHKALREVADPCEGLSGAAIDRARCLLARIDGSHA